MLSLPAICKGINVVVGTCVLLVRNQDFSNGKLFGFLAVKALNCKNVNIPRSRVELKEYVLVHSYILQSEKGTIYLLFIVKCMSRL